MTSSFNFKRPLPQQAPPSTPLTQLSARNFILPRRQSSTPNSVSVDLRQVNDDIDDLPDNENHFSRKRTRYAAFDDIFSEDEGEHGIFQPSVFETPVSKRPPVILPQPTPESPSTDLSPSRRQSFQPNGLAAYMAKVIEEHDAVSSVAIPYLDQEVTYTIAESKATEGGVGWICRINSLDEPHIALLLRPKGLGISKEVKEGDLISVSNAVKLDAIWICASWRHKFIS